jgi:SAM-dependent methyltransferase
MIYDAEFYQGIQSSSQASADVVVPMVLEMLPAASVLDVGCGVGTWLGTFSRLGVAEVFGVDRDVPIEALEIDPSCYCAVDVAAPFTLGKRFDLVVSLEVAEHLPAAAADDFTANLVRHGDAVLFSAAVPGQGGTHHVNEQWLSSWVERFAAHGFTIFDLIRARCWDNPSVASWYRQNTVFFARGDSAEKLARISTSGMPVDVVHPACLAQVQTSAYGARALIRALPRAIGKAVRGRVRGGAY